jgi:hypothetical protein
MLRAIYREKETRKMQSDDFADLTRVGPGTPMGKLMRQLLDACGQIKRAEGRW